jgi:hypothetical protein
MWDDLPLHGTKKREKHEWAGYCASGNNLKEKNSHQIG